MEAKEQEWSEKIVRLNKDSQHWITKQNFEEKVVEELFIPEAINYSDYYAKLRLKAFYADLGEIESKLDVFNNR